MDFAERIGAILQCPLAILVVPPEPKWLTALRYAPAGFRHGPQRGHPLQ